MKYKNIFSLLFFIVLSNSIFSQNIEFAKTYGYSGFNYGRDVIQTLDTGYFVLGNTAGPSGNSDIYIVKTDSLGSVQWQKTIGGNEIEWGNDLKKTFDKGYIIAGYTNRIIQNGYDILLVKIDSLGNEIWSKEFGGTDWDLGYSVIQTPDSGFVVVGETYSSVKKTSSNIFMIRTDKNGDSLWTKIFGGTGEDVANSVVLCPDSNYLVVGYTTSKGAGAADVYILKFDQNGDTLWTKTRGGIYNEKANDVAITSENGFMITGYSGSHNLTHDEAYFYKTNSAGDSIWEIYISPPNAKSCANSISRTSDNRYLWAGYTYFVSGFGKDFWYEKMDWDGNFNYSSTIGGPFEDEAFSISETSDLGMIMAGSTCSYGPYPSSVLLIKCKKSGASPPFNSISEDRKNENKILVFPNPVNENLNIIIPNKLRNFNSPFHFVINDILGRTVYQKDFQFEIENIHFNKGEINQGVYFYSITIDNNTISKGKLIFQ